jgi:hypothetical protein
MVASATADALLAQHDLATSLAAYEAEFNSFFLPHATGIKADSIIAKSPEAALRTYRSITSSARLQREFVDLTGRLISPSRFQAAYMSTLVKSRTHAQAAQ